MIEKGTLESPKKEHHVHGLQSPSLKLELTVEAKQITYIIDTYLFYSMLFSQSRHIIFCVTKTPVST